MALTVTPVVILAVWGAPWLAALVFPTGVPGYSDAQIAMVLRVMVVAMAASLILGAHFAALKGLQRSDVEVAAQVLALPANAAVLLVGLLHGWGLWALAFAQLAGIAVAASVQAVGTRRLLPHLSFRPGLAGWPVVLSYLTLSTLALVSQVGDVFDSQWDKLVIARYVDSEAVTAFHVGTMLVLQAKALALLPLMPLLAGVAELRVARPREAQELQRSLVKVGAVASAVVLGGVFVFAPAFILLWLGPGYEEAGVVARIFTVAVALNLVVAPIAFQAFAEGAHRLAAVAALTNIAVNAFASLLLTVQVGLYGAAVGSVVGNMAGAGVLVALGRRRLRAWVSPAIRTPVLAAGAGGAVVISGVADVRSWPWLLASVLLFALAVGVSAARLEGISLRAAAGALRRRRP
ncbi:O-antigen/teichoic acid export membrane protein [Phycicoccus duodecadis]|uniref:O-antigen/teichoic acid export membrane protein n=2 Tax=Phycicoccus duodecadis TaxID=173053 RepID=A0A2N3YK08_9MICO|nr:O-antigen/teichoic acid export membrane protein [Phycicoccus duodecadis]